jgi:transcription antitermination factor NusG
MATNKPVEVEELFGNLEPATDDRKWFVIRTKPRREKKLAKCSFKSNINYFLPLKDSERVYQYRKVMFTKPLFPGYVFVKCNSDEHRTLVLTGHTAHFLSVPNEKELTDELKQILAGRQLGADFIDTKYLDKGTRVKIISGPFEGLTGIVEDQNNIKEVVLQINLLRQAVSVAVSSRQVEIFR